MHERIDEATFVQSMAQTLMRELASGAAVSSIPPITDAARDAHHASQNSVTTPFPEAATGWAETDAAIHRLLSQLTFAYPISAPTHLHAPAAPLAGYRRDFPILQRHVHGKPLIWFDNAATSQKPQAVIDAISNFYTHHNANIHRGNHHLSQQASAMFDAVRDRVATFIQAPSAANIVFVRGTTEGINFIANTFGECQIHAGDEVLVSQLEHHSNILPWQKLCQQKNAILRVIPIDQQGDILLEDYQALLSKKTKLVAISHVSNVIGTLLPVQEMIALAHHQGAYVVLDGAQSIPHLPINVTALDCDFFVFSGHKMYGPTGVGVVYGKQHLLESLPPWQVGGGMIQHVTFTESRYAQSPQRFEAGTASIADVIGLGAAIDYLQSIGMATIQHAEQQLMAYAVAQLEQVPKLRLIAAPRHRIGALPFIIEGVTLEDLARHLDQAGIALRIGHHCAQPALAFFNQQRVARASFGLYNTPAEIDQLTRVLLRCNYSDGYSGK